VARGAHWRVAVDGGAGWLQFSGKQLRSCSAHRQALRNVGDTRPIFARSRSACAKKLLKVVRDERAAPGGPEHGIEEWIQLPCILGELAQLIRSSHVGCSERVVNRGSRNTASHGAGRCRAALVALLLRFMRYTVGLICMSPERT
jgi:hypothetical protein